MQDVQTAIRNVDTAKNAVLNADPSDEETLAGKVQDWNDANKALQDAITESEKKDSGNSGTTDTTVAPDTTAPPADNPPADNPPAENPSPPPADNPPSAFGSV